MKRIALNFATLCCKITIIPPPPPPSSGRVIFRGGLTFGVPLGLLFFGLSLLWQYVLPPPLEPLRSVLDVLLPLGGFFWAGVRGAKQTGRVGIGSLTGLTTAVFAGLTIFIGTIVEMLVDGSLLGIARSDRGIPLLVGVLLGGMVLWLLVIGVGAAIGALGGLLGRSRSAQVPPTQVPPEVLSPELPPPALPPTTKAQPGYRQPPYPPSY